MGNFLKNHRLKNHLRRYKKGDEKGREGVWSENKKKRIEKQTLK
jgi:hypothetical protein